jgi:hypothetical protein
LARRPAPIFFPSKTRSNPRATINKNKNKNTCNCNPQFFFQKYFPSKRENSRKRQKENDLGIMVAVIVLSFFSVSWEKSGEKKILNHGNLTNLSQGKHFRRFFIFFVHDFFSKLFYYIRPRSTFNNIIENILNNNSSLSKKQD